VSYNGSDDMPVCDLCNAVDYDEMLAPWPFQDAWHRLNDRPQHDLFLICGDCVRKAVLAYVRGQARTDALSSARRWHDEQAVREEARLEAAERLDADPSYQAWRVSLAARLIVDQAAREISSEQGGKAA